MLALLPVMGLIILGLITLRIRTWRHLKLFSYRIKTSLTLFLFNKIGSRKFKSEAEMIVCVYYYHEKIHSGKKKSPR